MWTLVSLCLQRRQGALCAGSPGSTHLIQENSSPPPHRTRFLPSWWGEMVSARSLSPGDDARQVKPPASSEPALSGTFPRQSYASSYARKDPSPSIDMPQQSSLPVLGPVNTSFLASSCGFLVPAPTAGGDSGPHLDVPSSPEESSLLSLRICSAGSPDHPSAQRAKLPMFKLDI